MLFAEGLVDTGHAGDHLDGLDKGRDLVAPDAATAFTGEIVGGRFMQPTIDDLHKLERGTLDAPYNFMKAALPPMIDREQGQVLMVTSSTGNRVMRAAPLYSALRAGATHLVNNVALDAAPHGVQVNALGTNFMDIPGFVAANGADTHEGLAKTVAHGPAGNDGRMRGAVLRLPRRYVRFRNRAVHCP